jgi:hypothetical protein
LGGSGDDGLLIADDRIDRAIVGVLRGQDLAGFEIWRWLGSEEGVPGRLTEAELYPTLYRLEADGLLQSDWHEGERTRRKYRLTAKALERADEHNWPPLAFHGGANVPGLVDRAGRQPTSPDPESGSWFMPRAAAVPVLPGPAAPAAHPVVPAAPAVAPSAPDAGPDGDHSNGPAGTAIAAYADALGADLDLPAIELVRVRQEIADHLSDSTNALVQQGYEPAAAAAEAMGMLGAPAGEATLIELAEHSPDRMSRGIRRGAIELAAEMVLWLTLSVVVMVLAPGVTDGVLALGGLLGAHLVVLRSAEWATNQMAIVLCVGAFAAGRMSLGRLARISRHSFASLQRTWALSGAAALLVMVLLLPGYEDALTVLTLLAVPVAFVAGTFRPQGANEGAYSVRAVAAAVVLIAVVTLLPLGRLFAYDPNATPNAPLAHDGQTVDLIAFQHSDGTFDYELAASTATGGLSASAVTVELWPASTADAFILVDPSAAGPAIRIRPGIAGADTTAAPANAQVVDLSKLPPHRQWWVAAVSTSPDGHRTALAVLIQTGASPNLNTALGWLVSKL